MNTASSFAKTALVFPGQGSQKNGMLAELAEQFSLIGQTFAEAQDALSLDLWQIAQGSDPRLDQTEFTQPILLTASVALWRLWQELGGVKPELLAGHSLGEYSALVAANVLSLSDAVRLVHRRGQLMQAAVPSGTGAMAAVLGLEDDKVIALCHEVSRADAVVEAANFNSAGQVVIAGHTAAVQAAAVAVKAAGGKALSLPVSVPSHCSLMQPAAIELAELLQNTPFHHPDIPIVQNARAQIAPDVDAIRQALIDQLSQPVLWTQTMKSFSDQGIKQIVECGAGNVLANLAKRMPYGFDVFPIDTRGRLDQALNAVSLAEGKIA